MKDFKNNSHTIKVDQFSLEGTYINTFDSYSKAAEEINMSKSTIGACCNGKQKEAGGFLWCRHEDT